MEFTNQTLKFHSDALSENQLIVKSLSGIEQLSSTFRFELDLLGSKKDASSLKLEEVVYKPAKIGIVQPRDFGGTIRKVTLWYEGVLSEFEQLDEGHGWVHYRAVLVPRLWLLNKFTRSRIFQEMTIDEMVTEVLTGEMELVGEKWAPLPEEEPAKGQEERKRRDADFQFNLGRIDPNVDPLARDACPKREYVVQYEETDFDLLSRWLEHEGIFYFFQNDTDDHENLVFTDHVGAYRPVAGTAKFPYRPQSAAGSTTTEAGVEEVSSFHVRLERQPKQVQLNDYNWRSPTTSLLVDQDVSSAAIGSQKEYNDHYKSVPQGKALATVRAEELLCREKVVTGKSTCRSFRPGRTFELEGHFVDGLNGAYLLTAVEHHAEQAINLDASTVTGAKYENIFQAIPADVIFRPACETEWPAIKGVMHGRVDGEEDGHYAQVDALGRYKLILPYDDKLKDASPGKASRWVRMAQPYAGVDSGFHFPLLKGTEVIVTHIDGDPDRPIIAAAVPNPETVSPVHAGNPSQNRVQTTSGNLFLMDDDEHSNGFVMIDGGGRNVEDNRMPLREGAGSVGPGPGYGGAAPGSPRASSGAPAAPQEGGPPPAGPPPQLNLHGLHPAGGPLPNSVVERWNEQVAAGRGMPETYDGLSFPGSVAGDSANVDGTTATNYNATVTENVTTTAADGSVTTTPTTRTVVRTPLEYFVDTVGGAGTVNKALDWMASYGDHAGTGSTGKTLPAGESYVLKANEWDPAVKMVMNVGDTLTIKEGGSKSSNWTFDNISNSIKFGTGGYSFSQDGTASEAADNTSVSYHYGNDTSYSETHGDVSSESHFHGATSGTSWHFGTITGTSYMFDAAATFSLQIGTESNTSVKIGAYNTNSIFIGGEVDFSLYMGVPVPGLGVVGGKAATDIFIGGKANLDIAVALAWKCELSAVGTYTVNVKSLDTELNASQKKKFSLDDAEVILKHDHAELAKTKAALKETQAALQKDQAVLKKTLAALKEDGIFLSETETALDKAGTALNETNTALNESSTALSSKDTALSKDITSALTKIQ